MPGGPGFLAARYGVSESATTHYRSCPAAWSAQHGALHAAGQGAVVSGGLGHPIAGSQSPGPPGIGVHQHHGFGVLREREGRQVEDVGHGAAADYGQADLGFGDGHGGGMLPERFKGRPVLPQFPEQSTISAQGQFMRVTTKGQITIPSEIRDRIGLTPNTEVILEVEGNTVRIRRAASEAQPGKRKRRPLSEEPFIGMWRDRR